MTTRLRRLSTFLLVAIAGTTVAGTTSAHVRYVVKDPEDVESIVTFVVSTLSVPLHAGLVGGGGLATVAGILAYRRYRPFEEDLAVFRLTMENYRDLLPWLLRLSLGIPLVGAGFTGYFFTPLVVFTNRILFLTPGLLRLLFIGLGFVMLFGLATRAIAIFTLLIYLAGLVVEPLLLLQFEYVGGLLALAILGSGRPSADDVLDRVASDDDTVYSRIDPFHEFAVRFRERIAPAKPLAPVAIRISLGLTFIYLGIVEKLLNPGLALAVVTKYDLTAVVPVAPELWVVGAALAEVAVGSVLVVGLYTRAAATISLILFTLTLFGLPDDPVLAHLTLFGLASALLITGAGPYSLDDAFGHPPSKDDTPTA